MKTKLVTQLTSYLEGHITLPELIHWANGLVVGEFDMHPIELEIIYRLLTANPENFELLHKDVPSLLTQLKNLE